MDILEMLHKYYRWNFLLFGKLTLAQPTTHLPLSTVTGVYLRLHHGCLMAGLCSHLPAASSATGRNKELAGDMCPGILWGDQIAL